MRSSVRTPEGVSAGLFRLCSAPPLGFSKRRESRNHKGTAQTVVRTGSNHTDIYTAGTITYNPFPQRLGGLEGGLLETAVSWRCPSASPGIANLRSWRLVAANRWAFANG